MSWGGFMAPIASICPPVCLKTASDQSRNMLSAFPCPLPISTPIHGRRRGHRQCRHGTDLPPVINPAMIPAPRALLPIADQVGAGDVVMVAEFRPAHAGEEPFGAVCVDASSGRIKLAVVDPTLLKATFAACSTWARLSVNVRPLRSTLCKGTDRPHSSAAFFAIRPSPRPMVNH